MLQRVLLVFLLLLTACSREPAPPKEAMKLLPWGSVDLNVTKEDSTFDLKNSMGSSLIYKLEHSKDKMVDYNILAISGGGSHGAYGVGLIDGWYHKGDMPKFDVVTGISTGSIISTFVFLGDDQIDHISKLYTDIDTSDIYHYNFFKLFGGSSVTSTRPLKRMLKEYITPEILAAVAKEYKKGRRLYIGTLNIDTGHLVVWDMGAIAASGRFDSLELYRDIVYASCAMPGVFDPEYFEIVYKDQKYYQLHVDGSMYAHVFMIGLLENWNDLLAYKTDKHFDVNLYVVANRKYRYKRQLKPLKDDTAVSILIAVATNAVDLLFDRSLFRLYTACRLKGYDFNYVGIADDENLTTLAHEFEQAEMKRLFDDAYKKGLEGISWQREINDDEVVRHY